MSELELHITTHETSLRLKKAGADFVTLFCWAYNERTEEYAPMPTAAAANPDPKNEWRLDCPAFLASELSNILGEAGSWTTYRRPKDMFIGFTLRNGTRIGNSETKMEAEGRGQVFAALLEQKLIGPKGKLELLG